MLPKLAIYQLGHRREQLKQANAAFRGQHRTAHQVRQKQIRRKPQGVWRQGKDAPDLLWVTARTLVSVEIIAQGNTFETDAGQRPTDSTSSMN